jgi:hypothetical protein
LNRKNAGRLHDAASSAAVAAGIDFAAGFRARSFARFAAFVPVELDDFRGAGSGFEKIEMHFSVDIAAAMRASSPAASSASAEKIAEQAAAEDIAEGLEDIADIVKLRRTAAKSGEPILIVSGAFFLVTQDLEGFGGFLEFGDGFLIARIPVGMIFHRQLAIRFGDLTVRRASLHAEDFVIIAFICHR